MVEMILDTARPSARHLDTRFWPAIGSEKLSKATQVVAETNNAYAAYPSTLINPNSIRIFTNPKIIEINFAPHPKKTVRNMARFS